MVIEEQVGREVGGGPFVVPRTLDQWMVTGLALAWPLVFWFVLLPNMDLTAPGEAIAWVTAFVIECGIIVALRNARRHA